MSWETDGPCRHKRQRPLSDSPAFWEKCAESDWVVNGAEPSFITATNERRATSASGGGYNLRSRVGRHTARFTQSEACGYDPNFAEQLQEEGEQHDSDDEDAQDREEGSEVGGDDNEHVNDSCDDEENGSDASYQDESEESSGNEYHPGERADGGNDDDDDEDDELSEFDMEFDIDHELDLIVNESDIDDDNDKENHASVATLGDGVETKEPVDANVATLGDGVGLE
jgi:hypothetical protein